MKRNAIAGISSIVLILALVCSPCISRADGQQSPAAPPAVDLPAVQMFHAWLKQFNAADPAATNDFVAAHFSESARHGQSVQAAAERGIGLRQQVGGFDLVRIEKSSANEVTALLKERGGMGDYAEFHLELDAASPDKIAAIQVRPTEPPADFAPRRAASPAELGAQVASYLDSLAAENKFSGAVLIAKDGQPILSKAYGLANRETREPNRVDTKFNLASMNKMFTGIAMVQLAEKGKLKFTDTLAQLLPDYPNPEAAGKITVHQLLTHTAGLGDMFGDKDEAPEVAPKSLRDFLPLFASVPLQFEPGSRWSYSNAGYIVLGLIIEKLSGQTYYDYINDHILVPAGMNDTGCYPKSQSVSNRAVGYTRLGVSGPLPDGKLQPNYDMIPWRGTSAGGCYSTTPDLLKFAGALRSHQLLSAQSMETLWTGKVKTGRPDDKYAYGFSDQQFDGQHVVGHNGGADGMSARMDMYLGSGYTVIVLVNLDPPVADTVGNTIRQRLPK